MSNHALVKMTLPGVARSASLARRWVTDVLTAAGHRDVDGARLIASELVTNAVLHTGSGRAGGLVTIEVLEISDAVARIEVIDEEALTLPTLREPGDGDCGGRGLRLVHRSSIRWGIRAVPLRWNSVWAEVATWGGLPIPEEIQRDGEQRVVDLAWQRDHEDRSVWPDHSGGERGRQRASGRDGHMQFTGDARDQPGEYELGRSLEANTASPRR